MTAVETVLPIISQAGQRATQSFGLLGREMVFGFIEIYMMRRPAEVGPRIGDNTDGNRNLCRQDSGYGSCVRYD